MKKGFYYIIALLIVSLFWSCSTKKNTKASRFYHAFNSRYNIYFKREKHRLTRRCFPCRTAIRKAILT